MLGKNPQGPTQSAFNGSRLLLSFLETLCASLCAWLCRRKNKNGAPLFFLFPSSSAFLFYPPPPFSWADFPKLFCYRVLPFCLARRLAQKMWCAYSTRKSVMLVLFFFLFFALHVLGFFFLSHGGGEKRHSNAFWCCSIKRRSCIWFSFFPLFFFLTVMMLKWCSCVTWAAVLLVLGAYWWCVLMLGRRSGLVIWVRCVLLCYCVLGRSQHASTSPFIFLFFLPSCKGVFDVGTYSLEQQKVLYGRREVLLVSCH